MVADVARNWPGCFVGREAAARRPVRRGISAVPGRYLLGLSAPQILQGLTPNCLVFEVIWGLTLSPEGFVFSP